MKRSLRSWLWRVPLDEEVDEELRLHVDLRTRELIARGMDARTARDTALSRLGDMTRLKRTCVDLGRKRDREMRLTQWLEESRDDVKFAVRQLTRSPGFALVAAITLALGIGANSAIFALADATFLRPLPFTTPADRLVMVWERMENGFRGVVTPLDFNDWLEQNRTFAAMAAMTRAAATMTGADGAAEQVPAQSVTAGFFDVLGVTPVLGRTFIPSDLTPIPHAVVLSEGFWRRRFGSDPTLVGREIVINERPYTVVGVVPAAFQTVLPVVVDSGAADEAPSMWILFNTPQGSAPWLRRSHYLWVFGRLQSDVTIETAQADMTAIAQRIAGQFPETNKGHGVALEPLRDALIGREVRLTSMLLLGVVGFVLLMCCANVANLLLARMSARARELAVRSALGAGRRRVIAQLLTESLVLAAIGGLLAVAIGAVILQVAPTVIPPGLLPNAVTLSFDGRVVVFCAVTALLVGLLFGLAPAWQSTGMSLVQALASDRRTTARGGRFRSALVIGELAAAVLVLSGAGLLLRTLMALQAMDPGYRADDVLTLTINLPMPGLNSPTRYTTPESLRQFYDTVQREVELLPGVRSAAWGSALPLDGLWFGMPVAIDGDPPKPEGSRDGASFHMVSPTYFQTLDIPIVRGRAFSPADAADGVQVCIVSEVFVRRFLGGREPLGMRVIVPRMTFAAEAPVVREIVGVARQVKARPNETEEIAQIYVPSAQNPWWTASLVVQPDGGSADGLVVDVRAAVARVDKERPVTRVRTIDAIAFEATSRPRFRAVLVGTFAGLALVLAMVGVFGVLAYSVQQRVREFGVRIALGAGRRDVLRLVFGTATRLTVAGLTIGLLSAALLSRLLATLIHPVRPLDPLTFALVAAVSLLTAAAATLAPAWRATRVDPAVTFRSE
jgi:putative ABC transport system permease protein